MSTLCKELNEAERKWFKIGVHSGVPYDKLQDFKKEDYPLAAVFDYCLKGNVKTPLTWRTVVQTLKSEAVGESGLAEKISQIYCQEESAEKDAIKKSKRTSLPQEQTSPKLEGEQ